MGLPALDADFPHEALRQNQVRRGGHEEGLDAHVDEPVQGRRRVVGVHGGEDEVAGEGGFDRNGRRLLVADLPHHDDIRVLPQKRLEGRGERKSHGLVHVDLVDPFQVVLDRVLRRHDVRRDRVDLGEGGVEGGGLPRAGGAGDQDHPERAVDRLHEVLEGRRIEPQLGEIEGEVRLVKDAEHDLLAEDGGERADAQVDGPLHDADLDASVLRHAPLGDVQIGHDLHAGDDGRPHPHRGRGHLLEHAVDPKADSQPLLVRLDVDIAGPASHRLGDQRVDELDHRGLVAAGAGVRIVVAGFDHLEFVDFHRLHHIGHRLGVVV